MPVRGDIDARTLRGVWQSPYMRVHPHAGLIYVGEARAWSADDYDLLEQLTEFGLTCMEIRRYFTPMPTATAIRCALERAGIPMVKKRGRPTKSERAEWEKIYERWKAGKL